MRRGATCLNHRDARPGSRSHTVNQKRQLAVRVA